MLSAKRSRHRIPIALVASCLVSATLPGVFCPIVCLTHEAAMPHGHQGSQMTAMAPCHTGDGVKATRARGDFCLVALPADGRIVLAGVVQPAPLPAPTVILHSAFLETSTPPPPLG